MRALVGAVLIPLMAPAAVSAREPPIPQIPAVKAIPVKVIVIANFEPGADMGDAPGEFQLWAEREKLSEVIPVKGALHPLRRNADGLYGMVWGQPGHHAGRRRRATDEPADRPALRLPQDLLAVHRHLRRRSRSGLGGQRGLARWVVQGDTLREFDDREVAKDWPYGLFAIGADAPNTLPANTESFAGFTDTGKLAMALKLNQSLATWAFDMTRDVKIPDSPELARARAAWTGYPNAQKPPFVLMGETLGAAALLARPGAHAMGARLGEAVDRRQGPVRHDQHGEPVAGRRHGGRREDGAGRYGPRARAAHGEQSLHAAAGPLRRGERGGRRRRADCGVRGQLPRRRAGGA